MKGPDQTSMVMPLEKFIQTLLALRLALADVFLTAASGGLYHCIGHAITVVGDWAGAVHPMLRESEPKVSVTFSMVCGALAPQEGLAHLEHPRLGLSTCAQPASNRGS